MLTKKFFLKTRMDSKDQEIYELRDQMNKMQQDFESYDKRVGEVLEKAEDHFKWQDRKEERRRILYDLLDKRSPRWKDDYLAALGFKRGPLTDKEQKKVDGFLEQLRNAPDSEDYYAG